MPTDQPTDEMLERARACGDGCDHGVALGVPGASCNNCVALALQRERKRAAEEAVEFAEFNNEGSWCECESCSASRSIRDAIREHFNLPTGEPRLPHPLELQAMSDVTEAIEWLEALEKKATPGPWCAYTARVNGVPWYFVQPVVRSDEHEFSEIVCEESSLGDPVGNGSFDMKAIAAARNAFPALLAVAKAAAVAAEYRGGDAPADEDHEALLEALAALPEALEER